MSMYGWDVVVPPGPPQADLQRNVLEEWLANPFLDDDIFALSLRLGATTTELDEALTSLCDAGFLRATGTGFTLALDLGGTLPDLPETIAPAAHDDGADESDDAADSDAADSDGATTQLASLSGAVAIDPATELLDDEAGDLLDLLEARDERRAQPDDLTWQIEQTLSGLLPAGGFDEAGLVEALPFGLLVLQPTGARETANRRAAEMLGLAPPQLDGATFELLTGVNPLRALDTEQPLSFSLTEPRPLEVTLQGQRLASGTVILVLLRDVSLLEEVSTIHADLQEELFQRLRTEMVGPLADVESFLEKPDGERLVQARIAMEQINWFLQDFFLRTREGEG
jgi:PAS domain-containing protein